MSICTIFALILCRIIASDSSFLTLDITEGRAVEVLLREQIIDYACDDHLFVCTNKNLYKIALSGTELIDQTPLPIRFNHLVIKSKEIILIATDEVIVLDRANLNFKSGIGIERGDHRPVVQNQSFATLSAKDNLYLASDADQATIIRILDLRSGRLLRKIRTARAESFEYDAKNQSFVTLDSENMIRIFDLYMNRKRSIKPMVKANRIALHPDGFLIYSNQGVQLVNDQGTVIDFQPAPSALDQSGLTFLDQNAIFGIDKMTLRPAVWLANHQNITRLSHCADGTHEVGIDPQNNVYLLDKESYHITLLVKNQTGLRWAKPPTAVTDSLWYMQLGAFSNPANAQLAFETMRGSGLPVFIDSSDIYRIKLGGFSDKRTGLHVTQKLSLAGWFLYEPRIAGKASEIFRVGNEKYIIDEGIIRKESE